MLTDPRNLPRPPQEIEDGKPTMETTISCLAFEKAVRVKILQANSFEGRDVIPVREVFAELYSMYIYLHTKFEKNKY
jgi:hypothetical protein